MKICKKCEGTGTCSEDIGTHSSDYIYYKCLNCNGTGRVEKYKFYLSVPYKTSTTDIGDVYDKVYNIIHEFENRIKKENSKKT